MGSQESQVNLGVLVSVLSVPLCPTFSCDELPGDMGHIFRKSHCPQKGGSNYLGAQDMIHMEKHTGIDLSHRNYGQKL